MIAVLSLDPEAMVPMSSMVQTLVTSAACPVRVDRHSPEPRSQILSVLREQRGRRLSLASPYAQASDCLSAEAEGMQQTAQSRAVECVSRQEDAAPCALVVASGDKAPVVEQGDGGDVARVACSTWKPSACQSR